MQMRKLAREAVIFALLGLFIAIAGCFVYLTKDIRTNANVAAAREVHSFAQGSVSALAHPDEMKIIGFVATFDDPDWGGAWRQLDDSILFHRLIEVPVMKGRTLYFTECQSHADEGGNCVFLPIPEEIAKDYWAAYKKSEHETLRRTGMASLESGLWGFADGIGIWILYRLVRLAVKGLEQCPLIRFRRR
jgi:hypothetical protein